MPSVRLEKLRKSFGNVTAVRDISIEFPEGRITSVLGPSGCGKTTTLNLIAGFLDPDSGSISFGDRIIADPARGIAVPSNHRNLGMVFQSYALWPHLTIGENVGYGLKMHKVPRAERDIAIGRALERVRLATHVDRYPHELSGGQQQRVALARAIAYAPQILLFDEPLSNLDAQLREEMRFELKEIHRAIGVTAIYVTHDQAEAMSLSDTIVVMGEGEVLQVGTPRALYEEPADVRVAGFIGKTNVLNAIVVDRQQDFARVTADGIEGALRSRTAKSTPVATRGSLSIRPEGIRLRPAQAGRCAVLGRVCSATYLGSMSQFQVTLADGRTLETQQTTADALQVGDEVGIEIDPERCYFIANEPPRP
jgi:ABC-type Fe3+/spermidine/putrescine transport system ATPase subunit